MKCLVCDRVVSGNIENGVHVDDPFSCTLCGCHDCVVPDGVHKDMKRHTKQIKKLKKKLKKHVK